MKQIFSFLLVFSLMIPLAGCALQAPNTQDPPVSPGAFETPDEPPAAPVLPEDPASVPDVPQPDPVPEPTPEPVFTVLEQTESTYLSGNAVTITIPKVELQDPAAAEIINHYFSMLSGKVRDYAEGDLAATSAITYTVNARYDLTYASDFALSFLWTVDTAASSPEFPDSSAVSAVTFDPATGALVPFEHLFGSHADTARGLFIQKARSVISQREANNYYYEGWNELIAFALGEPCFYLAEEGVCLFFTRDLIGTYTEVLLTWDELSAYLSFQP